MAKGVANRKGGRKQLRELRWEKGIGNSQTGKEMGNGTGVGKQAEK